MFRLDGHRICILRPKLQYMKKSEMFDTILSEVCELCEVDSEGVLNGCKQQSYVDARILCVQYLRRLGLTCDEIAIIVIRMLKGDMSYKPAQDEVRGKSRGVEKMFNAYSTRCLQSRAFVLMSTELKKFCDERFWADYVHNA